MGQPAPRAVTPDLAPGEQRFTIHNITWEQYEAMRAATDHLPDKLEVYRGLELPEVWIWKADRPTVWRLGKGGRYHPVKRSRLLPDLDVEQLLSFVRPDDQTAAVRAYRDALRA
jgi:hypothetical protein